MKVYAIGPIGIMPVGERRVQYDRDYVQISFSFRLGRAITWAPRKMRGGVQCYRDHGAGYTVRRTLYHMGLWEDEEAPKSPENRPKLILHAERSLRLARINLEGKGKEKRKW